MKLQKLELYSRQAAALAALCLILVLAGPAPAKKPDFVIKPYLQLGNYPDLSKRENAELIWFTQKPDQGWSVETKQGEGEWRQDNTSIQHSEIFDGPVHPLFKFTCELHDLDPGTTFDYRIKAAGELVMAAWAKSRKSAGQPYTFAVFGDCGAGTVGEKLIAWQCYAAPIPDFVVVPGDIVYSSGLFCEYMSRFFPVYNNNTPDQLSGVPLMRSVPVVAVVGNHDIAINGGTTTNFNKHPDGLAYYVLWNPPLNGPIKSPDSKMIPQLVGAPQKCAPFLKSAGEQYPRTAMFSFDYGNSHWLVLDGNYYMNWLDKDLRQWVENDLAQSHALWKFVTFHQPGFSHDAQHAREQRMRLLADIFQRTGVDIVFAGHAHGYQRTYPLTFKANKSNDEPILNADGRVPGAIELDRKFDGASETMPHGIIHIVTGGGGAMLYSEKPGKAQDDFIYKFVCNTHSLTRCSIDGSQLQFSQIGENGEVLDHFVINKK